MFVRAYRTQRAKLQAKLKVLQRMFEGRFARRKPVEERAANSKRTYDKAKQSQAIEDQSCHPKGAALNMQFRFLSSLVGSGQARTKSAHWLGLAAGDTDKIC